MVRLIEDVLHLARLHDLTAVHYKDSAAGTRNDAKIVRDQDNGCTCALLQVLQQAQHLRLNRNVQCSCRFIGNEQFRLARQCHGDHRSLTHTAGKLIGIALNTGFRIRDTDHAQHLDGLLSCFRFCQLLML